MFRIILWILIVIFILCGIYNIIIENEKKVGYISFIFAVLTFLLTQVPVLGRESLPEETVVEQEGDESQDAQESVNVEEEKKKTEKKKTEKKKTEKKVVLVKEESTVVTNLDEINKVEEETGYSAVNSVIEMSEEEGNDSIELANSIEANKEYRGRISEERDVDYYKFIVQCTGKINITFEHDKIDSSYIYWSLDLLDTRQNISIIEMDSVGGNIKEESYNARISPGEYYLKIVAHNYSDKEYKFRINFTEESEYYEVEENNAIDMANEIELNQTYTANLQTNRDVDYYKFSVSDKGKVNCTFEHEKIDSSYTFWRIKILDGLNDDVVMAVDVKGGEALSQSDSIRVPAGEYYIKVEASNYSNTDYSFCLKYENESEQYESEKNDMFSEANNILFGHAYIGNCQSNNDVDFYCLDISGVSNISVSFAHDMIDSSWTYWNVYFIPENENKNLLHIPVKGNDTSCSAMIENVVPGRYYLKIVPSSYHNMDYTISTY